jgi:O-acetyl-ADP-ribose deacetylase (regulator of RNase III)
MADEHVGYQIPSSLEERQLMMRALMNVWEPNAIGNEFRKMQDAELQMQREDKGVVEVNNEGLVLWQGDITRLKVDAIVNAANAQALGCWVPLHNCIDNCIHSAAGIQLRKECADKMQGGLLATGDAFITKGYNLPARHVIHTVGPIIPDGVPTTEQEEQLARCYRSCLDLAEKNGLESIAFCCISTGVFHFPNELAAKIAIETVKSYPRHALKTIVFNVFLNKDLDIYRQLLGA